MLNELHSEKLDPNIALVFPPCVNTNFGSYYPSTAVLSAYLERSGFKTIQKDLNEMFALYLLQDSVLDRIIQDKLTKPNEQILLQLAAKTIKANKTLLFDKEQKHKFQEDHSEIAYLLNAIAKPFIIDKRLDEILSGKIHTDPISKVYCEFFKWAGNEELLTVPCIGLSIPMGPQLIPSLLLAYFLKQYHQYKGKIIIGGPTISLMANEDVERLLKSFSFIDLAIKFDGEIPLLKVMQQISHNIWQPEVIPNGHFCKNGQFFFNKPTEGPRLGDLPFPNYDRKITENLHEPEFGIIQARGCYWGKCAYCDFVELYEGSPKYRTMKIDRFVSEIEYQIEQVGGKRFCFITESIPPAFASKFCDVILERNISITWNSFAMVHDLFTEELMRKMVAAGCEYLIIGIETMNDRVLKLVEKKATKKENFIFLQNAKNAGLRLKLNLIPDLPTTTYEEAIESLRDFESVKDSMFSVAIFPFEPTRSSKIGRNPGLYGFVPDYESKFGQSQYSNNHLNVKDVAMTEIEREDILERFNRFSDEINRHHFYRKSFMNESDSYQYCIDCSTLTYSSHNSFSYLLNWLSRDFIKVPERWLEVILFLKKLGIFQTKFLNSVFENYEERANFLSLLKELNILRPCKSYN